MGDSVLYDDDMLEEFDKHDRNQFENNGVVEFLNECNNINDDINVLSKQLNKNKVELLNINEQLESLVKLIEKQSENYDKLTMSDSEKIQVENAINKVKSNFCDLLNKHINRYNTKIDYINARIAEFTRLLNSQIPDEIREMIGKLEQLPKCEVVNTGDWRQLNYLEKLDYSKLSEESKKIASIEKKLNIKSIESVEIWESCNHINLTINEIEKEIKDDMTLSEINKFFNKLYACYEQIVDTSIRYAIFRSGLTDKKKVSSNNAKLGEYEERIIGIESKLREKHDNALKKTNSYKEILFKLDLLERKFDVMLKKINEYQGKCNQDVINLLNQSYLSKYEQTLLEIQEEIKTAQGLDGIQRKNLDKRIKKITSKSKTINYCLNISPMMLDGVDVGLDFDKKMKEFDKKLDALSDKIIDLGPDKLKLIKDHSARKDIDKDISARWNDIYAYDKLLSSYKKESPEIYKALKVKLDDKKTKFDKICKEYRGKCPLGVRQVKSAKHLYKKHRKEALIVAGLATMVLLLGHSVIIPAIIQGNLMLGTTIPALSAHLSTVNSILGGMIGATKTAGNLWFLPSSGMFTPAHAVTSLLKGVAYSGLGNAALLSPVIASIVFGIKNLATKINSVEYKEKLKLSREKKQNKKAEKKQDKSSRIFDKFTVEEMGKLFYEYRKSGESLDDFAKKNNLSQEEISALMYLENKSNERKNVGRRSR